MTNRKGVFIGAYVPVALKTTLQAQAKGEHRSLSQEITRILENSVQGGNALPFKDRRHSDSSSRKRVSDPPERRRNDDLPIALDASTNCD